MRWGVKLTQRSGLAPALAASRQEAPHFPLPTQHALGCQMLPDPTVSVTCKTQSPFPCLESEAFAALPQLTFY